MSLPLAYFLSWTCYGQRLHGDARGSVDRSHNVRGTPMLAPDPGREVDTYNLMNGPAVTLSADMIVVVDSATVTLCEEKGWRLLAHNIRPSHSHVVVNCRGLLSPERALAQLKARATRDLRRGGLAAPDARLWTRHGSTRWINPEAGLFSAIGYVNDWQSGSNRELLEEHKERIREQLAELRTWLRSQGLPESGRSVVVGETGTERALRLHGGSLADR